MNLSSKLNTVMMNVPLSGTTLIVLFGVAFVMSRWNL